MGNKKLTAARKVSILIFTIVMTFPTRTVAANRETVLRDFQAGADGHTLLGSLVFDKEGRLYGTATFGGDNACPDGCGVIFELTRGKNGGWTEKILYAFQGGRDGQNPNAGVILDKAGNLYGTTPSGGSSSFGTVFMLSPRGDGQWKESVLHNFTGGRDGGNPFAGLILDKAQHLYGTTVGGGDPSCYQGCGTVFELVRTGGAWKEVVLYSPSARYGEAVWPYGGLAFDSQGNLYGTSSAGGSCCGTVFRLVPSGGGQWSMSVLYSFKDDGQDGYFPFAGLVLDDSGNIFGTTVYGGLPGCINLEGCGTVFQLTPTAEGSQEEILYRFTGGEDGGNPFGGLILDPQGNLLGTTFGTDFIPCSVTCGTVFRLFRDAATFSVLHRFEGSDGAFPDSSLIVDKTGNLYGTTISGGRFEDGVVFEITY